jgi:hypothetical protein
MRSVSIFVLVALAGCTTVAPKLTGLPDSIKSDVYTVAVTAVATPQAVTVWRPSAKDGAREGATTAMQVATALTYGLWPIAFYFAGSVVVPTVGAGIGAIVAAIKAPPQKEVDKIEMSLREVVEEASLPNTIRDAVVTELKQSNPRMRVLALDSDSDEDRAAKYRSLAGQGVGAILEVETTRLQSDGPWGSDPRGNILMTAAARIIRTVDGVSVYSRDFEFVGNHDAGNWFQTPSDEHNNPRLLQERLTEAAQTLGRDIARALFTPSETSTNAPTVAETESE